MTDGKTTERQTYAVSLYLDDAATDAISAVIQTLSEVTGNTQLTNPAVPPHITLGMFHASEDELVRLRALFDQFAAEFSRSFTVSFSGTESFADKVLFLSVKKSVRLTKMNARLHELVLPQFESGGNRNYLSENWFPHVALARKLNQRQFEAGRDLLSQAQGIVAARSVAQVEPVETEAMEQKRNGEKPGLPHGRCAQKIMLPESAKIVSVGLSQCNPYREMVRVELVMDSLTAGQRHKNMAAIKSTGGVLETTLRSQLFRFGFRFRKNDKRLSGSPDIVFPHYRAVVFVNGCFWHAHGWKNAESVIASPVLDEPILFSRDCGKFRMPATNPAFWHAKFERNRERDKRDIAALLEQGWRVGVVWECSITGKKRAQKIRSVAEKISLWLEENLADRFREF